MHLLLCSKILDSRNSPVRSVRIPSTKLGFRRFRRVIGCWPHRFRSISLPYRESALSLRENLHRLFGYTIHPRHLTLLLLPSFHGHRAQRPIDYPRVHGRPETEVSQRAACSRNVLAESDLLAVLTGDGGNRCGLLRVSLDLG